MKKYIYQIKNQIKIISLNGRQPDRHILTGKMAMLG
jgi:hypothetical protein